MKTTNSRRISTTFVGVLAATVLGLGGLVAVSAAPAHADDSLGEKIAALARANEGKKACSKNSLGGTGFSGSCPKKGSSAWCSRFARWVWKSNGVKTTGITASAASVEAAAKKNGSTVHKSKDYKPQLGDIVTFTQKYYDKTSKTWKVRYRWAHVAVITKINSDGSVKYTNGNWGGTSNKTSKVVTKTLNKPAVGSKAGVSNFWVRSYTSPGGVKNPPPPVEVPARPTVPPAPALTIASAAASPATGSITTLFSFVVKTDKPAAKLKFHSDLDTTDYWVSESGKLPTWGATAYAEVQDQKVWTIKDHTLAPGIHTITVTAYDANGVASAPKAFSVAVDSPIAILSATPHKTSGKASSLFGYTVITNVAASKLTFKFSGNSNTYTVSKSGPLPKWGAKSTAAVSADRTEWVITKDDLRAGNRTITVTAYDMDGNPSAPASFKVKVT